MTAPAIETRLIRTAIRLFGANGFESVGTRAIAEAAGVQMSAITYHFGGKDGLYLACARHIAAEMAGRMQPALEQAELVHNSATHAVPAARAAVLNMVRHFTRVMLDDDIADVAQFVAREQMRPTEAFTVLYSGVMQNLIETLGRLLQCISGGSLRREEMRLRPIALVGQILAFRFSRAALMAVTGWQQITEREIDEVVRVVVAHTGAVLTDLEHMADERAATGV